MINSKKTVVTSSDEFFALKKEVKDYVRRLSELGAADGNWRIKTEDAILEAVGRASTPPVAASLINGILAQERAVSFEMCLRMSQEIPLLSSKGLSGLFRIVCTRFSAASVESFLKVHADKDIHPSSSSLYSLLRSSPKSVQIYLNYLAEKPHLIESLFMACIQKNKKVVHGEGKAAHGFIMANALANVETAGDIFLNRVPDIVWENIASRLETDKNALSRFQKWNASVIKSKIEKHMLLKGLTDVSDQAPSRALPKRSL